MKIIAIGMNYSMNYRTAWRTAQEGYFYETILPCWKASLFLFDFLEQIGLQDGNGGAYLPFGKKFPNVLLIAINAVRLSLPYWRVRRCRRKALG